MKKVNLLAVVITVMGMNFVSNVNAVTKKVTGNENTISVNSNFDFGIIDPDDPKGEDDEKRG